MKRVNLLCTEAARRSVQIIIIIIIINEPKRTKIIAKFAKQMVIIIIIWITCKVFYARIYRSQKVVFGHFFSKIRVRDFINTL